MPDRIVGSFVVLAASRAGQPLVLPAHTNPFNGTPVPEDTLYGGQVLRDAIPLGYSVDGTKIILRGVWTGEQLYALAFLSHEDGTGGTVLSYEQVMELMQTPEWAPQEP